MGRSVGSVAAAIAAGGMAVPLALVPGQAARAASAGSTPSDGGGVTAGIGGVPSRLPVGGSFTLTVTVKSTSPYKVLVEDLYISMWNTAQAGLSQTKGITATWKDSSTGAWRASSGVDANGGWSLAPQGEVYIAPKGTFAWQVRIAMSSAAKQGTEHIQTSGVSAWALVDPATGQGVGATLDYNLVQTSFTYGSGSGSGGGSGSTSGGGGTTTHTTAPARPAKTTARPSHSPSRSAEPSRSASTPPSPSASVPASGSNSASASTPARVGSAQPSVLPTTHLDVAKTADSTPLTVWAVVLLIVAAAGAGVFATRRARRRADHVEES